MKSVSPMLVPVLRERCYDSDIAAARLAVERKPKCISNDGPFICLLEEN